MVGNYPLTGAEGSVSVTREGLYHRFSCRYTGSQGDIQRLVAITDHGRLDLGICVPVDGGFGVDKRIPRAKTGDGIPEFRLVKASAGNGIFVPVYPYEPFVYVSKLKGAFLEIRGGKAGIRIQK